MQKIPLFSIVSPVYRAENTIEELVKRVSEEVEKITSEYEIILVEDCGPDNSWEKIQQVCQNNKKVIGIKLSRNFGQHYAITAGLDHCNGEWVIVMDCDLQDRPDQISKFYKKALEGYDVVQGRRQKRQHSFFKKFFSKMFYSVLAYLSGYKQDSTISNFGIYNKKVISSITSMRENIRFFPTMVAWVGFKKASIEVEHSARLEGKSTYTLGKLFNLALDVILAYSDKPLRLITKLGLFTSFLSFVYLLYNLYKYVTGEISVMGYASLIVSLWFLSGLLMFILGIVGLYVGKTFEGTKRRPIYIVDQKLNTETDSKK